MELNERIAFVRKAAGLSQEQLGQQLGVTRQAVSKWESGQSVPDVPTLAKLCQTLHVSADFILLGLEPEESGDSGDTPQSANLSRVPWTCPCCLATVPAGVLSCPDCHYAPFSPENADDGTRYALICLWTSYVLESVSEELYAHCGIPPEEAKKRIYDTDRAVIRRDLKKAEACWMAAHISREVMTLRIVEDEGETIPDEELLRQPEAIPLPEYQETPKKPELDRGGLGFGGTVMAVVVGIIATLLIFSFL